MLFWNYQQIRNQITLPFLRIVLPVALALTAVKNVSRSLAKDGFGVLRFDFTGLGRSEGEFLRQSISLPM